MNAIELKGLEKHYGDFDLKLDLTLPEGCILGLVGENGAGKSTTIRLLLGMAKPDAGSATVLGQERPPLEEIGVVLDEPAFPECLSAKKLGKIMAGISPASRGCSGSSPSRRRSPSRSSPAA